MCKGVKSQKYLYKILLNILTKINNFLLCKMVRNNFK